MGAGPRCFRAAPRGAVVLPVWEGLHDFRDGEGYAGDHDGCPCDLENASYPLFGVMQGCSEGENARPADPDRGAPIARSQQGGHEQENDSRPGEVPCFPVLLCFRQTISSFLSWCVHRFHLPVLFPLSSWCIVSGPTDTLTVPAADSSPSQRRWGAIGGPPPATTRPADQRRRTARGDRPGNGTAT